MDGFTVFVASMIAIAVLIFSIILTSSIITEGITFDCNNYGKTIINNDWYSCSKLGE